MSKELFEDNFFDDFFGEKSEEENISTKNGYFRFVSFYFSFNLFFNY